jgi:hypothetical protein
MASDGIQLKHSKRRNVSSRRTESPSSLRRRRRGFVAVIT